MYDYEAPLAWGSKVRQSNLPHKHLWGKSIKRAITFTLQIDAIKANTKNKRNT